MIRRHTQYLKYVVRHKWFVFLACRDCKVSLAQAIVHDWHKFLPGEWIPYAECFYKPDGSKQYVESPAFNEAWRLHQRRGKHHWQHWLITWDRGETEPLPMPEKYVREMVADWIGAGWAINGVRPDVKNWKWLKENIHRIKLHPETKACLKAVIEEIGGVFPDAREQT